MISQRSDYDFVTIPGAIKINGEIMPRRANKNELRGEDPSFLLEADAERHAIWSNTDPGKTVMTREIRGDRLRSIANSIREDVTEGRFIKPWPSGPVYDKTLDLASTLNLKYTVSDLASSPADFTRGHPLVQSDVGKLFTDTDLLRVVNLYSPNTGYMSGFSFSHTYTHDEIGDAPAESWEADATTLYDYRCSCSEMSDWDGTYWYGKWREAVASGGSASLDIGSIRSKYIRPVTSVWAICTVSNSWTDGDSTTERRSNSYAAFRASASMTGSNVTVSIGSLVSGAKTLLAHYGFSKLFQTIQGSQSAVVYLSSVLPIVEMGDRTRWETETGGTT